MSQEQVDLTALPAPMTEYMPTGGFPLGSRRRNCEPTLTVKIESSQHPSWGAGTFFNRSSSSTTANHGPYRARQVHDTRRLLHSLISGRGRMAMDGVHITIGHDVSRNWLFAS